METPSLQETIAHDVASLFVAGKEEDVDGPSAPTKLLLCLMLSTAALGDLGSSESPNAALGLCAVVVSTIVHAAVHDARVLGCFAKDIVLALHKPQWPAAEACLLRMGMTLRNQLETGRNAATRLSAIEGLAKLALQLQQRKSAVTQIPVEDLMQPIRNTERRRKK